MDGTVAAEHVATNGARWVSEATMRNGVLYARLLSQGVVLVHQSAVLDPSLVPRDPINMREAEAMDAGMTQAEAHVWDVVASAAGAYLRLTETEYHHPMEREEICHAFHVVQGWLAGRALMRAMTKDDEPGGGD